MAKRKKSSSDQVSQIPGELVKDVVACFKILGDPTRFRIVCYLGSEGELHVSGLCDRLKQNQPAVSHHLALLKEAGMIDMRRQGKRNYYRLQKERLSCLAKELIVNMSEGKKMVHHDGLVINCDT